MCTSILYAQIGINTTTPNATLDIRASDQASPANTDGILIPRVDAFSLLTPTADQNGMLVYLTTLDGAKPPGIYSWDNATTDWLSVGTVAAPPVPTAHYIGELFGGGIVYQVSVDGQHGLLMSLEDLNAGAGAIWGSIDVPTADSFTDGNANTNAIVTSGGLATEAAGLCNDYSAGGFADWYLPSIRELKAMTLHAYLISSILEADGDPLTTGLIQENTGFESGIYWSSTQVSSFGCGLYSFDKQSYVFAKSSVNLVRAVRSF